MALKTMRETIGVIRGEVEVYGNPPHVDGRRFTEDDRHRTTSRARYRGPTRCRLQTLDVAHPGRFYQHTPLPVYRIIIYLYIILCEKYRTFYSRLRFQSGQEPCSEFYHFFNLNIVKICFNPSTISNQSWDAPQVCSRSTWRELRIFKQRVFLFISLQ